ncbi:response regulator [Marinimicrococcus flavescens]|uniref:Response regulator n=1 Tax=Marinimicrococcus flavescens TaxID=3031815 RepID=A0AAP3V1P0_9PROT|nr:response regulator [Marinimicrococcus flavescens]
MSEAEGKRLLVVEDEFLIAFDLQGLLERAGHTVVGPAGSVAEGLALAGGEMLDGALLDINLQGEKVTELANALAARGVPFLFLSGYGASELPPGHDGAPVLPKPFNESELLTAVAGFAPRG